MTITDLHPVALPDMNEPEARECVRAVNSFMQGAREMLLDLYERKGWRALGYKSWRECVVSEFKQAESTLYRQLEAASAERDLSKVSGDATRLSGETLLEFKRLPAAERREVALAIASSGALKVKDMRQIILDKRQRLADRRHTEAMEQLPIDSAPPPDLELQELDCAKLPWRTGSVQLIVTSPPYALDMPYADVGDPSHYGTYLDNVDRWCKELLRVTDPNGGRICINVPLDRSAPTPEPIMADWTSALLRVDFKYKTTLLWMDNSAGRGNARGSVDSPGAPNIVTPAEGIIICYRGEWNRSDQTRSHNLSHENWLQWTGPRGLWTFPGEGNRSLHPAPFPVELPDRLIRLYSYRGDTVADPFCGRGTTALAGLRLGRKVLAGDKSPTYVQRATAWINSQLEQDIP